MNSGKVYELMHATMLKGTKQFAVLIDPDGIDEGKLMKTIQQADDAKVDYIYVGGSLVVKDDMENCISIIKENCSIPVVIFPGSTMQVCNEADAIFFLSLISGRNPDLLIGQHVLAAPLLKESGLEVIPTGYVLVDGGRHTTVSYISNTIPIPADKDDIAACTVMAGEMLGLKSIYMDAGSGAQKHIPNSMISKVNKSIEIPLIVGGGIKTPEHAAEVCMAGADIVVVGDAIEKEDAILSEISIAVHSQSAVKS